jgi:hypothetical protein
LNLFKQFNRQLQFAAQVTTATVANFALQYKVQWQETCTEYKTKSLPKPRSSGFVGTKSHFAPQFAGGNASTDVSGGDEAPVVKD